MNEAQNFVEKELWTSSSTPTWASPSQEEPMIPIYIPPQPQPQASQTATPETSWWVWWKQEESKIQIIEKVIYKKQKIHGFFRTLTILALLAIGFLMWWESTGMIELTINNYPLHNIYPMFIIISTIVIRSYRDLLGKIFGLWLFLKVFGWIFIIGIYTGLQPVHQRKAEHTINIPLSTWWINTFQTTTLFGEIHIQSTQSGNIKGIRHSDRKLLLSKKDTHTIYLQEDPRRNILQHYQSNLTLHLPETILRKYLYLKNFIGKHTIDLRNFERKNIIIHGGIQDVIIQVGKNISSWSYLEYQAAIANLHIDIPQDIGVILKYKQLWGKGNFPWFIASGNNYLQSTNIHDAKAILYITIAMGLGNISINRTN